MMVIRNPNCLAFLIFLFAVEGNLGCFNKNTNSSRTLKTGDTFYIECVCSEPGQSAEQLRWVDPQGQQVELHNRPGAKSVVFAERSGRSLNLFIAYVSKSRAGTYRCEAGAAAGRTHALSYHILAYDPLYFVDPVKSQFLTKGQDSIIKCEARGETKPEMFWYKSTGDSIVQLFDDEKYAVVDEGLKVKQVSDEDQGEYRCVALVVDTEEEEEQLISVEVLTKPSIKGVVATPDQNVVIGDALTIECIATGVPTLEYRWLKTNPNMTLEWTKGDNKLSFHSVKADDRGVYECVASNRAGSAAEAVTIEVLIPPKIVAFKNVTGAEGSIVHIICNAVGRPVPSVNIVFEKQFEPTEISVVSLNVSETENSLVVSFFNLSRHYDGSYFCNATNEVDTATGEAALTVHHKPYLNSTKESVWAWAGLTINLSCPCESNPPADINWWYQVNQLEADVELPGNKNEHDYVFTVEDIKPAYGTYKCLAQNYLGNSTKFFTVTPASVPSDVNNFTVLEVTASSVTFDLEAPQYYQGPAVIGFTAEYDEASNYERISIHDNRSWAMKVPFKIEKLKPNTKYRFKFAAINVVGHGNWSQPIDIDTPEKSVPDQPTTWLDNFTDKPGDENIIVRWKSPENNGEPVDLYFLQYCPFTGDKLDEENCTIVEIAALETEFDLTGLLEGNTTYEILLAAHNSLGNSSGAQLLITVPISDTETQTVSAQVVIGLSVLAVITGILALDLLLLFVRRQGMIASCLHRKNKKHDENTLSRDKKGLLRDNDPASAAGDSLRRAGNGGRAYERTRATGGGVITGKHSSV